jgi:hypothetical protein
MNRRAPALLPAALVALAEAAWISVVEAAAVSVIGLPNGALGLWPLAALVAMGIAFGRSAILRERARPSLARAVAALGVAGGIWVLVSATPSRLLLDVQGVPAAAFAALAIWQGSRHADRTQEDVMVAGLLRLGLPGLAIPWLAGATLAAPARDAFVADAMLPTLLFVAASLSAIGLTRLDALGRESGVDWSNNRAWLALLAAILLGMAGISLPAAFLLGAPIVSLAHWVLGPPAAVVDLTAAGLRLVTGILGSAPSSSAAPGDPASGGVIGLDTPPWTSALAAMTLLAALVVGVVILVRRVGGAPQAAPGMRPLREVRRLELPMPHLSVSVGLPWLALRRRPRAASVTAAYLGVLAHLERRPELARSQAETPRAHARRVHPVLGWRMSLLVADFELERYATTDVRPSERRRALRRARWLRRQ